MMGQFRVAMTYLLPFPFTIPVLLISLVLAVLNVQSALAAEGSFPLLPGLEGAVEFWKQAFTRYGSAEVIFFDPVDPATIYSVVRAPDTEEGRAIVEKERARVIADYDLNEDGGRIKSQRGARDQFISGLKLSGRYLAQMEKIFRGEGLPRELAYLPLVESSFNVRARSSVGAVGMWQFMPDTGKKFLRIDDSIDERRDPLASTRAAARLLKQNYRLLGNWPLAITAYNHGTEGLFHAMSSVGSDNLVEIIKRYEAPNFGFASKNFYAEFLAAVDIATHSESYFPFLRIYEPSALQDVDIKRAVAVPALLKPAQIAQADFFSWNPALNPTVKIIPSGYRVKVPPEKVNGLVAAQRHPTRAPVAAKSAAMTKSLTASAKLRSAPISDKVSARKMGTRHAATPVAIRAKTRRLAHSRTRLAARPLKLAVR